MEQQESWMHQIRELASPIEKTEYEVYKREAQVKKLQAQLKLKALAEGIKPYDRDWETIYEKY